MSCGRAIATRQPKPFPVGIDRRTRCREAAAVGWVIRGPEVLAAGSPGRHAGRLRWRFRPDTVPAPPTCERPRRNRGPPWHAPDNRVRSLAAQVASTPRPRRKLFVRDGRSGRSPTPGMTVSDSRTTRAEAFCAHAALPGSKNCRNACQFASPCRAYRKRQGWMLKADGAHRPASKMVRRSASGIGAASKARGDQRSRKIGSIG